MMADPTLFPSSCRTSWKVGVVPCVFISSATAKTHCLVTVDVRGIYHLSLWDAVT